MHSEHEKPSAARAFFGGFGSGAFNGALMMGLFFGVAGAITLMTFLPAGLVAAAASVVGSGHLLASAALTTLATGLFSGVMAAKHAVFDAPSTGHGRAHTDYVAVPTTGMASPALAPSVPSPDMVEETALTRSWVSQTGREQGAEARVQQILANGAMSDKDRAGALLAAREAAEKSTLSQAI